ncbi:MAG: hypothetical protein N2A99_02260 [Carnobacterium alterfunditum]
MRKTSSEKIKSIEEQIQELKEKKQKMLTDLQISIGKTVISEWESTDEKDLVKVIKLLKEEALNKLSHSTEDTKDIENESQQNNQ